jgi:transcription antitermination protein NusB
MPRPRIETRARSRVLQALYAWDLRGGDATLERVATQVWDDLAVAPEERQLASLLVRRIIRDHAEIDADIGAVTTNWRLERLGAIERCVLRLAAAELRVGQAPPRVIIQEAIRLAERYGSARSAHFVNGVADALARRMGLMQ